MQTVLLTMPGQIIPLPDEPADAPTAGGPHGHQPVLSSRRRSSILAPAASETTNDLTQKGNCPVLPRAPRAARRALGRNRPRPARLLMSDDTVFLDHRRDLRPRHHAPASGARFYVTDPERRPPRHAPFLITGGRSTPSTFDAPTAPPFFAQQIIDGKTFANGDGHRALHLLPGSARRSPTARSSTSRRPLSDLGQRVQEERLRTSVVGPTFRSSRSASTGRSRLASRALSLFFGLALVACNGDRAPLRSGGATPTSVQIDRETCAPGIDHPLLPPTGVRSGRVVLPGQRLSVEQLRGTLPGGARQGRKAASTSPG